MKPVIAVLLSMALVGCVGSGTAATSDRTTVEAASPGAPDVAVVPAPVPAPSACRGTVALTFDDGPTPSTGALLKVLARSGVRATFFNRGDRENLYPGYVEQEAAAGHQLGNHTWDHPDLLTLSPAEVADQIRRTNEAHTPIAGAYELFRPPYGGTNPQVRAEARRQGMLEVLWTLDSKDYAAASVEQIIERSQGMDDRGILLMHDGMKLTLKALPSVVNHYHSRGMCFGGIARGASQMSDLGIPFAAGAVSAP